MPFKHLSCAVAKPFPVITHKSLVPFIFAFANLIAPTVDAAGFPAPTSGFLTPNPAVIYHKVPLQTVYKSSVIQNGIEYATATEACAAKEECDATSGLCYSDPVAEYHPNYGVGCRYTVTNNETGSSSSIFFQNWYYHIPKCPDGYRWYDEEYGPTSFENPFGTGACYNLTLFFLVADLPISEKERGCQDTTCGNPIQPGSGNKFQVETDYPNAGDSPLKFVRYYNSIRGSEGHWSHTYDRRLLLVEQWRFPRPEAPQSRKFTTPASACITGWFDVRGSIPNADIQTASAQFVDGACLLVKNEQVVGRLPVYSNNEIQIPELLPDHLRLSRPDGKVLQFKYQAGNWLTDPDQNGRMISTVDGYQFIDMEGNVENYSSDGRLVSIVDRRGRSQAVEHDAEGRVLSVTDHYGKSLSFEHDTDGRLIAMTDPEGNQIVYTHTLEGNFASTKYQDDSVRTFLYENTEFPNALTGIIDENGDRYSSWEYDANGRATLSEHAGGTDRVAVTYNSDRTRTVVDASGKNSDYAFEFIHEVNRAVSRTESCAGCAIVEERSVRDSNGNITMHVDRSGMITLSTYETARNLELTRTEAVGTPEQRVITTQWHATLNRPTQITEPGRVTEYTYDANGNRLSQTISDTATGESRTTSWTYNSFGQVLTVDDPRTDVNDVTTYTYDGQGNLETVTNALGQVTRYTQYDAHGNPLEIIDVNGVVTELEYDLRQRLVRRTVAAGTASAATTHFEYDLAGQLIRTTLPNGAWIAYEYDAAHRMTAISDSIGNRIDYVLDAMGNRVEEKVSGADGSTFRETFRTYNQFNRLVAESGPEGSVVEYGYDAEGNRTAVTDAAGNATTRRYDALDRLFESVDALGGVTAYQYDPRDNLTQVIDPRSVTTDYVYNGFNELIETRSPDAGTTTYRYDAAGNRISQTDARGITVHYEYDALNRLTFIDYPGTDQDITYTYDQGPNGIGRLSRIDDETGYTEYSYDVRGNLSHKLSVVNSATGEHYLSVGYSHDVADNLSAMTYPSGDLIQYQRDTAGRVTGINLTKADGTQVSLVTEIQYAPFGPATRKTFGNGISETRSFDREGRITRIQSSLLDYSYSWNVVSNITAITDNLDSTRTQSFDYDALYRLTDAAGIYGNLNWQYDAVGNRTAQSDNGADTLYGYAAESNRLVEVSTPEGLSSYIYDEAGNTLDDGKSTFDYDARNRFVQADGQYRYAHNALGQRVTKPRFQTSMPGDLDGDGVIDENDLLLLRDILRGRAPANPAANCNGDGTVDNRDTSCIANQIGDNKNKGNGKGNRGDVGAPSPHGGHRGANLSTMNATASTEGPGTIVGQILFTYDEAGHLIGEYDETGNRLREYVWLGDTPVAMVENGNVYYIHSDHLNTPKVVTDENQTVVWRADYKPFGEVTETVSTIEMPLRYPGQVADEETGLHYNYFRTYDPSIGRYTQSDPIGLSGGPNTFAYVEANPILYMDRAGLFCIPLWSETSEWKNTGNLRNAGKTVVLPQSFGGFGTCSWKRLWLQKQERTVTARELCYDCEEKCEGEECSWKIRRGTPRVETRDHERWESGGNTNQVITGGPGREQGCCQNPWNGALSCGPIYPRN